MSSSRVRRVELSLADEILVENHNESLLSGKGNWFRDRMVLKRHSDWNKATAVCWLGVHPEYYDLFHNDQSPVLAEESPDHIQESKGGDKMMVLERVVVEGKLDNDIAEYLKLYDVFINAGCEPKVAATFVQEVSKDRRMKLIHKERGKSFEAQRQEEYVDAATANQMAFLRKLGYEGGGDLTFGEASELIDQYKEEQKARREKKAEGRRVRA